MQKAATRSALQQRTLVGLLCCEKNQNEAFELSWTAVETPVAFRKHKTLRGCGNLTFDKLRHLKLYRFL
jgi:hypothetical protein